MAEFHLVTAEIDNYLAQILRRTLRLNLIIQLKPINLAHIQHAWIEKMW